MSSRRIGRQLQLIPARRFPTKRAMLEYIRAEVAVGAIRRRAKRIRRPRVAPPRFRFSSACSLDDAGAA